MPVAKTGSPLGRVVLISLEPWDDVWRRNQHLASRLPILGLADHVTFVNPARASASAEYSPVPGVTVVSPRRWVPKRLGGHKVVATSLRLKVVRHCDTIWINDPNVGAWLGAHDRAVYDVTDDWRSMKFTSREKRRLIAAEDLLATRAQTVVCSEELRRRWETRYGIESSVVRNAADSAAISHAQPRDLGVDGPHVGYVGTLHESRLNISLVLQTAEAIVGGQVHLVGPDNLTESGRSRLTSHPRVTLHGSVPAPEVPSWLLAFDVLICPHVVNEFTRSLDAIKAYEYLATAHPVVATPTSGFQELEALGLYVGEDDFAAAVCRALVQKETFRRDVPNWDDRAREFVAALVGVDTHPS